MTILPNCLDFFFIKSEQILTLENYIAQTCFNSFDFNVFLYNQNIVMNIILHFY